ncbi:sorbosone dehydrogenase family protein, partial [Mycobacterium hodleri]
MSVQRPTRRVLVLLCAALLVGSGCARFDDNQSQPFTTQPEMGPPPS